MLNQLMDPFSSRNLNDALYALALENYFGGDGVLPCFFVQYWELLKEILGLAFQEAKDSEALLETYLKELNFLILMEGGDLAKIRSKRLTEILNSLFKTMQRI